MTISVAPWRSRAYDRRMIDEDATTQPFPPVPRPEYVRAIVVLALVFGPWIAFAIVAAAFK